MIVSYKRRKIKIEPQHIHAHFQLNKMQTSAIFWSALEVTVLVHLPVIAATVVTVQNFQPSL